jgi:hypothetical protein
MKRGILSLVAISLLIFSACQSDSETTSNEKSVERKSELNNINAVEDYSFSNSKQEQNKNADEAFHSQKIIKNGNISIKTLHLEKSKAAIDQLVQNLGAYYQDERLEKLETEISYNLTIRIPSRQFEKLIFGIEKSGDEITDKSLKSTDVSEEYVDIETRLQNKRAYLNQYRTLLSRANKIEDILAIEDKVRNLEEEIESKEGRLKYLSNQIEFSTLQIQLFKEIEPKQTEVEEKGFFSKSLDALQNGVKLILNLVLFLLSIWPLLIVLFLVYFFVKRYLRKKG